MDPVYTVIQVQRDQPGSAQLMEYASGRIERMSARFGGNAALVKSQIWELYAKASPLLGLWLAFKDDQPIGHLLGQVQSWDGHLVGWVNQAELDTVAGHALKDTVLAALDGWIHTVNRHLKQSNQPLIRDIMMVTRRGTAKHFDHWSRHGGFDPYLTVYRRAVHPIE